MKNAPLTCQQEANKQQFQEAADDLKTQHIDEDQKPAETERMLSPKVKMNVP